MKATVLGLVALFMGVSFIMPFAPSRVYAAGENLITNADVESGDTNPTTWTFGSWGGVEATTMYSIIDGSTGKALGVNLTTAGSGDAKWYHERVPVTETKIYTYSDSYKSDVNTDVIMQYELANGSFAYDLLANAPASSTWTTLTKDLVIPSGVTHITFFHIISSVGQLWTDNFSLTEKIDTTPNPNPTPTEFVLNASFETDNNGTPTNWLSNAWGNNTSTFEYANTGNTGSRSGHVTTTDWTDGDAKWYHDAVMVTAGKKYTFRDFYKSTINTEVVAQYTVGAGAYQYAYLGTTNATSNWTQTQLTFTAPANATHVTIFHLIAGVGELWVDDYSITEYTTPTVPPTGDNLISNPSVEVADGVNPANWSSNNWGSNTAAFEYATSGQDGSRSLHVTVSNFVDGDAKWYHNQVAVLEHSKYTLSNYYKATAPSQTVLQYDNGNGNYSYKVLGTNATAADWTKSEYSFEVPHGVTGLTIFHVMAQNGELWTDNYDLRSTPGSGATSNVPNGNLEEETNEVVTGWFSSSWGENNAIFEYLHTGGYNSDHAVKTTVTSYVSGDAKWVHTPVQLTPGVNYRVTNHYKSDVDSRIVLDVTMQDGTTQFLELPGAPASADWTEYAGTFTMPAGAFSVAIYHLLSRAGTLTTDNYDINEYLPVPFSRALLTLTFDDGWEENVTTTLPLMQQYGYKSNQFYATTFIQNSELGEAEAITRINKFIEAGHEVGSHTITHPDLTTLTAEESLRELVDSKAYLKSKFTGINDYFATPYGAYNALVKSQIMANYTLHRTVDVGYNSKDNFDVTRLKVQNVLKTTTAADVARWVQQAQEEGTWLILVLHRVAPNPGDYDTTQAIFAEMLAEINNSGIDVVTITQALAELQPQL